MQHKKSFVKSSKESAPAPLLRQQRSGFLQYCDIGQPAFLKRFRASISLHRVLEFLPCFQLPLAGVAIRSMQDVEKSHRCALRHKRPVKTTERHGEIGERRTESARVSWPDRAISSVFEMNLRHLSRTPVRINYSALYIMPCTVSGLRVPAVPAMDGVLKMLGHVGSFI